MTLNIFSCLCFAVCVVMAPNGVSGAYDRLSNLYRAIRRTQTASSGIPARCLSSTVERGLTARYNCTAYASGSDSDHPENIADCFPG
jgi:hypothetical protein